MRVAHVITRLILGGAQENTLLNCEDLLRDYGDDVLLITGPALGPEGGLIDRAVAHGVPLRVIPELRREIHPLRDAQSYRAVKRALHEFAPDVVHTHSAKGGILGRAAAHALRTPAIVHTVHGAPFHPQQPWPARQAIVQAERWAARRCHALISVADAMTELLVEARVAPRQKFTTIRSGMEVEPFLRADEHRERVRRELGYAPEHVVVGKVARLFHLKGHEDVIAAAGAVIARAPNVRFLFVGDGVLRGQLQRQIAAAGLTPYFQFTGLLPAERIPEIMGAIDVLAHCSLREGLARVLPQALIAGRPAISYDVDGAREVVLPGATGILLPPRDVAGLADAIVSLAADPALRAQFGAEGRRRFTDEFRHERMTERIRELYERVLVTATPPLTKGGQGGLAQLNRAASTRSARS